MHTLLELLEQCKHLSRREAIRYDTGYRTLIFNYRQLYQCICGITEFLQTRDFSFGDRIVVWSENRPGWIALFWAALSKGLVIVPVDVAYSADFVNRITHESGADLIFTGTTVETSSLTFPSVALERLEDLKADNLAGASAPITPDTMVEIVYTSGTTGRPKGIIHRHRNICADLEPFRMEIQRWRFLIRPFQPLRMLNTLPLSHMFGQALGIFIPLIMGGSVVFTDEIYPLAILQNIRRHKVSVLVAVPRFLDQTLERIKNDFNTPERRISRQGLVAIPERWWRFRDVHNYLGWKFWTVVAGGAPLARETEDGWSRLGLLPVQGYGLTEASPIVAVNHPLHPRHGSLGQVLPGQEVKIAEDGEILIRGDNITAEFYGKSPEEQAAPMADEWLHSGDLGELDEDGYLYYKGRKKDVIVTAEGYNVYPEDVEEKLNTFPEILNSVVSAKQTPKGAAVTAVVIPADENSDIQAVIEKVNKELETHQRIASHVIWPEQDFPRTPSTGKVKRWLVSQYINQSVSPGMEEDFLRASPKPTSIEEIIARRANIDIGRITEDSRLNQDLGLSSLDHVALIADIEKYFDKSLDEQVYSPETTVRELKNRLQGKRESQPLEKVSSSRYSESYKAGRDGFLRPRKTVKSEKSFFIPRLAGMFPIPLIRHLIHFCFTIPLLKIFMDIHIEGRNNLKGISSPVIFAPNHTSLMDVPVLLYGTPFKWRGKITPAVRREYFDPLFNGSSYPWYKSLWFGCQYLLLCCLLNAYPLSQRPEGVRDSLRFTGDLIDNNKCPVIFPEGRLTQDGNLQTFQSGIGMLAVELKAKVVPVYIEGLYKIMPHNKRWPRRGKITIKFGKSRQVASNDTYESFTRNLESHIRTMAEQNN
ncbi:MAG: AMP-binding protein [Lentisphaeria bacterium]